MFSNKTKSKSGTLFLLMFILCSLIFISEISFAEQTAKTKKKPKKKTEKTSKKSKTKDTVLTDSLSTEEVNPAKKEKPKQEKALKGPQKQSPSRTNVLDPEDDSMSGTLEWKVVLKDDNGNLELPERYRTWWYVRLDGVNTSNPTTLNIEGDGFAGKSIVLPVYSYDRINWHRLTPEDIITSTAKDGFYNYSINKLFDSSSTVWLARYYPYSFSRLERFIKSIEKNQFVKTEKIGESKLGNPIYMLTITDFKTDDKNKKRIWIHARTHPSETGSSFVVEGLVKHLISDCNASCKDADLSKLIFHIVPMVNPDGVSTGNARVTPDDSYDLERTWFRAANNYDLTSEIPPETRAMHSAITKLEKKGPEFIIALNLHSKNAPTDWHDFLYTNFYKKNDEYGTNGDSLFIKQLVFTHFLSRYNCKDSINMRISEESGKMIEKKHFPEMWWWLNFKDMVMAVTLETTTGYNGCFEEWVSYKDQEYLGEALAKACNQYYKYFIEKQYYRFERPPDKFEDMMEVFVGDGK